MAWRSAIASAAFQVLHHSLFSPIPSLELASMQGLLLFLRAGSGQRSPFSLAKVNSSMDLVVCCMMTLGCEEPPPCIKSFLRSHIRLAMPENCLSSSWSRLSNRHSISCINPVPEKSIFGKGERESLLLIIEKEKKKKKKESTIYDIRMLRKPYTNWEIICISTREKSK
jgi:hypothetical protein